MHSSGNQKRRLSKKFTAKTIDFFTELPPARLSDHIRTLLLDHLIEVAGNYGIQQTMVIDLQKFFEFMALAHKQRKKWKQKTLKKNITLS